MKEKILALLATDDTVTQQYSDTFRRSEPLEPEKALLVAVLEDAIHCFRKYRGAHDRLGRERFQEAEDWIMRQGNDWIFSFDNVCDLLGLDPEHIRKGLRGWRDERPPQHQQPHRSRLDRAARLNDRRRYSRDFTMRT